MKYKILVRQYGYSEKVVEVDALTERAARTEALIDRAPFCGGAITKNRTTVLEIDGAPVNNPPATNV